MSVRNSNYGTKTFHFPVIALTKRHHDHIIYHWAELSRHLGRVVSKSEPSCLELGRVVPGRVVRGPSSPSTSLNGSLNDPWHLTSDGSSVTGVQCMHICVDLLASGLHILANILLFSALMVAVSPGNIRGGGDEAFMICLNYV